MVGFCKSDMCCSTSVWFNVMLHERGAGCVAFINADELATQPKAALYVRRAWGILKSGHLVFMQNRTLMHSDELVDRDVGKACFMLG